MTEPISAVLEPKDLGGWYDAHRDRPVVWLRCHEGKVYACAASSEREARRVIAELMRGK